MNYLTETASGLRSLSQCEADMRLNQLRDQLPHTPESQQPQHLAAIGMARIAATPEDHFDMALFTPSYYEPGWTRAA